MPTRTSDIERTLSELYQQQADSYERLLVFMKGSRAQYAGSSFPMEIMSEMEVLTNSATAWNARVNQVKREWESLRRPPGPTLAQAVARVRTLLASLVEEFQAAEKNAASLRDKLLPEISTESRRIQMRQAYGRATVK
jgi:hypothetical protein